MEVVEIGKGRRLVDGEGTAILSIGPIGNLCSDIARERGCAHYDMRFLKPLDEEILAEVASRFSYVITVEDGVRNGGLGSAVLEWFSDHGCNVRLTRLGLPDNFVEHGSPEELYRIVGLDREGIERCMYRL